MIADKKKAQDENVLKAQKDPERQKDAEDLLGLALMRCADERHKVALEGKDYKQRYAELASRLDRDVDVDYVTRLSTFR